MAQGKWTKGGTPVVVLAADASWNEGDHPRAANGQFGSGGGSSKTSGKRDPAAVPTKVPTKEDILASTIGRNASTGPDGSRYMSYPSRKSGQEKLDSFERELTKMGGMTIKSKGVDANGNGHSLFEMPGGGKVTVFMSENGLYYKVGVRFEG